VTGGDRPFRRPLHRAPETPAGWPAEDDVEPVDVGNGTVSGAVLSRCCGASQWYPPPRCTGCGHRTVAAGSYGLSVPQTRTLNWRYWGAELAMRVAARFAGRDEL
jgi:hypothetical protein